MVNIGLAFALQWIELTILLYSFSNSGIIISKSLIPKL